MPENMKEGLLKRDQIGQALFDPFLQEKIVEDPYLANKEQQNN